MGVGANGTRMGRPVCLFIIVAVVSGKRCAGCQVKEQTQGEGIDFGPPVKMVLSAYGDGGRACEV